MTISREMIAAMMMAPYPISLTAPNTQPSARMMITNRLIRTMVFRLFLAICCYILEFHLNIFTLISFFDFKKVPFLETKHAGDQIGWKDLQFDIVIPDI